MSPRWWEDCVGYEIYIRSYADADGDLEGSSTFRWLRNGTTTVGTGATYTLDALDSGQTITFEVHPVVLRR